MQRSLGITALSLMIVGALPSSASAEEGELSLSAGVTAARWSDPRDGSSLLDSGVTLGMTWWFTDFWSGAVRLRGASTVTGEDAPSPIVGGDLEARYVLDALTWVPWACAGVGGSWGDHEGPGGVTAALVHAGLGMDYRPSRSWSVALSARYRVAITDLERTSGPMELTVGFRFYPQGP
ncbi:MAG: hypothetical protein VYE15_04380 [Myxococcota bacterium]|nr:hypothetical protein [Myxococcota bacterium]